MNKGQVEFITPTGEKVKLPKGLIATAVLAFAGAGTILLNLMESLFGLWPYSVTPSSNLVGTLIGSILFLTAYIMIGVLILKRRGFVLGITIISIILFFASLADLFVIFTDVKTIKFNLSPQIEFALDIALFVLLLVNRKKLIKPKTTLEISREAKTTKGVIWAAVVAFSGAVLFIICIILKSIFESAFSVLPIPIILIIFYIITGLLILRAGRAGFAMGIVAAAFSFLIGSANISMVIYEVPYVENPIYIKEILPLLVFANCTINIALFVLLIVNRRRFQKRKGPLLQPVYDVENAVFDDHRYHYERSDIRRGYAKKQAK